MRSTKDSVLAWLTESKEPSIRYHALTQLVGLSEDDPEAKEAKERLASTGWGKEILRKQDPTGWWVSGESLSRPKYTATY